MGLLNVIKNLVYTGGTNDLDVRYHKANGTLNLMTFYQEKFQDIQAFRGDMRNV